MAAQISALPSVPSRQDPTNFNDRADAFLGALPTFQSEANALSTEVNTRADNVQSSYNAVLAATNITKWASGSTYANGAVVWSPINGLAYRRITASGSGTTDPSLDTTNYKQVNGTGDVSTSGNQTIAGVKTFSNQITASGGLVASNLIQADAGIQLSSTNGNIYSGTYTSTITSQTNCSGSLFTGPVIYTRIGNAITISWYINTTVTSASGTLTEILFTLPVGSAVRGTGTASVYKPGQTSGAAIMLGSATAARVIFYSTTTGGLDIYFSFTYYIL